MSPVSTQRRLSPEITTGRLRLSLPSVALLLGALMVLLLVADIPLSLAAHQFSGGNVIPTLLVVPFAGVGVMIANRQPGNPIGWILLTLALIVTISADAGFYSVLAYRVDHHDLPLSRLAVALATGWVALIVLLPLPILLFPDGRLPARRWWRWTLWAYLALSAIIAAAVGYTDIAAFTDRQIKVDSSGELASLAGPSSGTAAAEQNILFLVWASIGLSWVIRQLVRYRRSTGDVRQQLKWLMCGGAICIIGFAVSVVASGARAAIWQVLSVVGFAAVAALPISIGVGILKYRLYDIDRLISRTLSYAILTGLLAGGFFGLVVLTTDVLPFSSPVGVTAATLAAAVLFNPLRLRVQRLVDRRFNRARYDAEAIVATFTALLRDAIDLETVCNELVHAVDQAVEPSRTTLWIRPPGPRTQA